MVLKAPAKINIGLHILAKRSDGFHDIETIFFPVLLFDEIRILISRADKDMNSIIIKSEKSLVPINRNNTCVKAIEAFFRNFNITDFFKIEVTLKKNIPIGGGLGGGSSDAGAVLRFLIRYFNIDIAVNRKQIMETALEIGSDVPFFLIQKPCYATGRGEHLRILKDFIVNYDIMLVNPNLHVSTKWAYGNLNITEGKRSEPVLADVHEFGSVNKDIFSNDFEEIVFGKYPVLFGVKEELYKYGAAFASLSGSGAVMYGFFEKSNRDKMKSAFAHFNKLGYFIHEG